MFLGFWILDFNKKAEAELSPYKNEFFIDIGPVNGSTVSNYSYVSLFNPSASGRTIIIKRITVKAFANAAGATYANLSLRRITSASGGTQIIAANIPKKNNYSSNPVLEIRYAGPTVTFAGTTNSRILSQSMPGGAGQWHSIRDVKFNLSDEPIILQVGEGLALYQEAAGSTAHVIRLYAEWEEILSTDTPVAQNEFLFAFPRVENAGAVNYVYQSFFNPSGSGRTAIVKRIWFGSETCDAAAVYTNNLVIRRISAASGGTAISATEIPKKHSGSSNSAMDFRHAGVTVTAVGGTDARLAMVTPCAAAGQPHGFMYLNFDENDEKLILQPGEGIALIADSAGNENQLIRLVIEWQEVTITPSSQNEYLISSGVITGLAFPANTTFFTFFNPSGSGRTVLVKRLLIRNDTDGAANYAAFSWRRLIAASGGILIATASIPKKHTGSGNSAMQIRWCGSACGTAISATYSGSADSRLLTVNGPGAVGQVIGHKEIVFGNNEKLVLQQGEGIGFYIETSGNANFYVKVMIEWQEITTSSLAQSEYLVDIGPVNGSTTANYVYASVFNPAASGRIFVVKRISLRIDAAAAAVYIPMSLRRITSASGGTQITSANIPKKNSGSSDSVADIRRTGVTVNFVGSANARLVSVTTPGAVGASAAPHINGYQEFIFKDDEKLILKNGEGIALYQENAATNNTNLRVKILIEWQEITNSPAFQGEYLFYSGNILGNIASGYVYSSFFNPLNSGKNYLIKRMGVRVDRTGAATTATYIPLSVRKVNSASGGTLINATDILAKNTSALTSTAEIRTTSPTVNFIQANESRILGVTQPGAVGENYGIFELEIVFQDELMLAPGEGFALYQESNAGDTNFVVRLGINWSEINITYNQSAYRFFSNLDSTDVGGPLASQVASQDTAAILSFPGQAFRLRLLLHVATGTLPLSGQGFKLQFAQRGSDNQCDINFSGENYSDVTTTTAIAYHNNLTPADGVALTANANDPIHGSDTVVNQTYEEVNNFTNSISPILSGQDGKWDFSLRDNNAPLSTSYCFRIVKSDGSLLDTYSLIPQITTASPVVSVSVSDGTVNYGIMPVNTAKSTLSGELNDMQTATNDGNVMEIFNIKGIDASGGGCNWNLASNNGVNQYVHQFCNDTANDCSTPPANYIALTTSYQTLATNVSPGNSIQVQLRIITPTSSTCYGQQSVNVTIQAVQQ